MVSNRILLLTGLILVSSISFKPQDTTYDICIYGGTSAGVIAAYTAAQMGKKVVLIEPGMHLGGMTSGGLGYTDIGNKYVITGLAREFYREIGKHYGKLEQWTFEPHVAENIFKQYTNHPKITVLYKHHVTDVAKEGTTIRNIILEHASTKKSVSAKMYMDCSYEGDLMAKANVQYTVGRESNDRYNETYNGVQLMDGHQFPDGVDPYKREGDPSSGLLWGISDDELNASGTGDKSVQAYNYRICLTSNSNNSNPITSPENYDSTKYELLLRLIEAQPNKRKLNDYFIISKMPNDKTDINNRGGFSTDMIGMNHSYPEATYAERKEIIRKHEDYTKGLLYFMGHDSRVPTELREEMLQWGYPKDEYADNGNWSPQPYVRESRRMKGAYVMTQHNCQGREVAKDTIGLAAYTMDSHNCRRLIVNGMVKNEGNVEIGGFGPYPVAYSSITPNANECVNLLVPVCLSASHIAYGSIRMEPVFMVLAQSAAVALSIAIEKKQTVQQVNIPGVLSLLRKNPLMDGSVPDILVDDDNSGNIEVSGKWRRVTSEPEKGYTGNYGPGMMVLEPTSTKSNSVSFIPDIKTAGDYSVYYYVPKVPNASKQIAINVNDGRTSKKIILRTGDIVVEGQTSGEWAPLGKYKLPAGRRANVTVTDENADGAIIADAVLFVHQK
ncbi:MAG: FAD-dependent oxidoreductase [Chitinophagaceae bacterium]|nr:FAD-dependent oxidoreductase [Chitinophagaceae bacterium]